MALGFRSGMGAATRPITVQILKAEEPLQLNRSKVRPITGIPSLAHKCPRQTAQKALLFFRECGRFFSLTLPRKSGKVIKIKNAMTKPSTRPYPPFRELPLGARQQKDCAEFLSERLC